MTTSPDRHGEGREDLERLRREIEDVDRELIRLIARRVGLAREVGIAKRAAGLPALDPAREAEVLRRASEVATREGASEEDVHYLFRYLIEMARRAQVDRM